MLSFKKYLNEVKLGKNPCWAGYAPVKGDELKKKGSKFVPNCVKEDGEGAMGGPTNTVGGVAGTGDSRLPANQREPGVNLKKKKAYNPVIQSMLSRKAPKI